MSREKARALFLGQSGIKKHNCAQAVAAAFKERCEITEALIESLGAFGSGKAPGGLCGALYAVQVLFEKSSPHIFDKCRKTLVDAAGSAQCKDIRKSRKLSCLGCVEAMAEIIAREHR